MLETTGTNGLPHAGAQHPQRDARRRVVPPRGERRLCVADEARVGFGDAVTPGPVVLTYPTFLTALPAPDLTVYPIESVVAEKWEATYQPG